ncbi:serine/threonine-protein kinase-like protein At5g23170 [Oryza brachyantha]|uniref:serine/threonine-protein kinase-like protein At5g23170 n=1 Tax=Oryza brachyantha TaxID=4533 RepID=UPI001ADABA01|nr:serine/threonine-protein kinase-like protein At5g23170 [Oryza brachyantha]
MREFSYEEVEAATGGFAAKNLVGKGSHGSVYMARLRYGAGGGGGRRRVKGVVAIKKASHAQGEAKLANEIAVLAAAGGMDGVVNLVGVVVAPAGAGGRKGERMLVMEYMANGSLHDLLHRSPKPPPWPRRVEIALDVAEAVRALHAGEPRVIHRDVKSANILLGRDGRARLADFSLAVKVPAADDDDDSRAPDDAAGPAPAGTIGYLDPCYTEPGRLGPESDVFSFGVVLLELVSGRKVMDVNASPSSIVAWAVPLVAAGMARQVLDGRIAAPRCPKAERAVARVLAVAARCVSEFVERRPAMADVVAELHGALESAGWPRRRRAHGLAGTLYRRVVSWGASHLHVRRSKIECTEHSGSEGSCAQPDHPCSNPLASCSNENILE